MSRGKFPCQLEGVRGIFCFVVFGLGIRKFDTLFSGGRGGKVTFFRSSIGIFFFFFRLKNKTKNHQKAKGGFPQNIHKTYTYKI